MDVEFIKGDFNLNDCPEGILVIPLFCNLLPIAWVCDATLYVNELDETLSKSIINIKNGYIKMYEPLAFKGKVKIKNIVNYDYTPSDTSLSFFSLGADSLNTVLNNMDKNPKLITLFGSDMPLRCEEGWSVLSNDINEFAETMDLENFFIKSDFRLFLNYDELNKVVNPTVEEPWWYGFQHGIGIISHGTVIAYLLKARNLFMASTHSNFITNYLKRDIIRCASSPLIDSEFKFASCQTKHDGYEFNRLNKIQNIVNYKKENKKPIKTHVCWASITGKNCSVCEKCARTILAIMSEGEDPNEYGFEVDKDTLNSIKESFYKVVFENETIPGWTMRDQILLNWKLNQENFLKNEAYKNHELYDYLLWYLELDLDELIHNFNLE